jgi:hypothetical protein
MGDLMAQLLDHFNVIDNLRDFYKDNVGMEPSISRVTSQEDRLMYI